MEDIDVVLGEASTTIARDLTLNLKRLIEGAALEPIDAAATVLATARSAGHSKLEAWAEAKLKSLSSTDDEIREARESAAIMGMLNTYYRFRHLLKDNAGEAVEGAFGAAGLRMTSLAKPALGKVRFEMLAFAVSVLNGCGACIAAHEKTLRDHGVEVTKIHDLARIASVVKGLSAL